MRSPGLQGDGDQDRQGQEEITVILKAHLGNGTKITSAVSKPQEKTNPACVMCIQPEASNHSPLDQVEDLCRVLPVLPALRPLGREIQDTTSLTSPCQQHAGQ